MREDEVCEPYGSLADRSKDPNDCGVPGPLPVSVHTVPVRPTDSAQPGVRRSPTTCHSFSPPMGARLGGEGRRGLEDELCTLPQY